MTEKHHNTALLLTQLYHTNGDIPLNIVRIEQYDTIDHIPVAQDKIFGHQRTPTYYIQHDDIPNEFSGFVATSLTQSGYLIASALSDSCAIQLLHFSGDMDTSSVHSCPQYSIHKTLFPLPGQPILIQKNVLWTYDSEEKMLYGYTLNALNIEHHYTHHLHTLINLTSKPPVRAAALYDSLVYLAHVDTDNNVEIQCYAKNGSVTPTKNQPLPFAITRDQSHYFFTMLPPHAKTHFSADSLSTRPIHSLGSLLPEKNAIPPYSIHMDLIPYTDLLEKFTSTLQHNPLLHFHNKNVDELELHIMLHH